MFYSRCFLSLLVFQFNWQTNKTYYLQSPHEPRAWGAKLPQQVRVWLCSPHCRI